jgi:hypothetical protein
VVRRPLVGAVDDRVVALFDVLLMDVNDVFHFLVGL